MHFVSCQAQLSPRVLLLFTFCWKNKTHRSILDWTTPKCMFTVCRRLGSLWSVFVGFKRGCYSKLWLIAGIQYGRLKNHFRSNIFAETKVATRVSQLWHKNDSPVIKSKGRKNGLEFDSWLLRGLNWVWKNEIKAARVCGIVVSWLERLATSTTVSSTLIHSFIGKKLGFQSWS